MLTTIEEVRVAVEANRGILTLSMEQLRDAYGAGKLGKHILIGISKSLAGQGLGHFPLELPNCQHENVRVYKLGSPVSDIIDAVFNVSDENDDVLRQAAANDEAVLLRQVRQLLCD